MSNFYVNLKDEVENLTNNPELDEYQNFLVNGKELNIDAQLIKEKNRILLCFAHLDGQKFELKKYNDFRIVIEGLSNAIYNLNGDYEILKKIIVHLDLELGIEILFTNTLFDMVLGGVELIDDYEKIENFSYETLYNKYKDRYKYIK